MPHIATLASMEIQKEHSVRLSKAVNHYCRPDILEEYRAAGERAGWDSRRVLSTSVERPHQKTERNLAVDAYLAAQKSAISDLEAKMRDGRLVSAGFPVGPSGRAPDAKQTIIPDDVLKARDCHIDWQKETISGNGLTFVGVRVHASHEAPEFASSLIGLSLAECFKLVVIDDWVRQELEEVVFERFPGWRFTLDAYDVSSSERWPVHFESWPDPAYVVTRFKHPIIFTGAPDPEPPEEVVSVRKRIEAQVQCLIGWLRDGTLLVDGIKEPKDHVLTRLLLPHDWWKQADVQIDTSDSELLNMATGKPVSVFSDIRIVAPEATPIESEDTDIGPEIPDRPNPNAPTRVLVSWFIQQKGKTKHQQYIALTKDNVPMTRWAQEIRKEFGQDDRRGFENESGLYKELRKQFRELKEHVKALNP